MLRSREDREGLRHTICPSSCFHSKPSVSADSVVYRSLSRSRSMRFRTCSKHAIDTVDMLDFLKEIVEAVPDPSAGGTIDVEAENAEARSRKRGKGKEKKGAGDANGGDKPAPRRRRKKAGAKDKEEEDGEEEREMDVEEDEEEGGNARRSRRDEDDDDWEG